MDFDVCVVRFVLIVKIWLYQNNQNNEVGFNYFTFPKYVFSRVFEC